MYVWVCVSALPFVRSAIAFVRLLFQVVSPIQVRLIYGKTCANSLRCCFEIRVFFYNSAFCLFFALSSLFTEYLLLAPIAAWRILLFLFYIILFYLFIFSLFSLFLSAHILSTLHVMLDLMACLLFVYLIQLLSGLPVDQRTRLPRCVSQSHSCFFYHFVRSFIIFVFLSITAYISLLVFVVVLRFFFCCFYFSFYFAFFASLKFTIYFYRFIWRTQKANNLLRIALRFFAAICGQIDWACFTISDYSIF